MFTWFRFISARSSNQIQVKPMGLAQRGQEYVLIPLISTYVSPQEAQPNDVDWGHVTYLLDVYTPSVEREFTIGLGGLQGLHVTLPQGIPDDAIRWDMVRASDQNGKSIEIESVRSKDQVLTVELTEPLAPSAYLRLECKYMPTPEPSRRTNVASFPLVNCRWGRFETTAILFFESKDRLGKRRHSA
jgi:hypothetical protein